MEAKGRHYLQDVLRRITYYPKIEVVEWPYKGLTLMAAGIEHHDVFTCRGSLICLVHRQRVGTLGVVAWQGVGRQEDIASLGMQGDRLSWGPREWKWDDKWGRRSIGHRLPCFRG
jgi:hypothetical protein